MPPRGKSKKRRKKFGERHRIRVRRPQAEEAYDYKNVSVLQRLTTQQGKLFSRKRAGNDAWSQRKLKLEVKRARFLALLPYVG
ncbi:MAG: 30S ribosomal protein S18 [Planctomycetota bacterium JB042]